MNKDKVIAVSKDTVYYLTNFFPLAFCMAVCFGLGATTGIVFACITIILAPDLKTEKIMPVFTAYIILSCNYGNTINIVACSILGSLIYLSPKNIGKFKQIANSPAISGVMLSTALTATVLFTTDYFGIGATGERVTDMIKSYLSLGFHPNWRGVLYGTIVMVIMITFPRKFKTFSKTVSAAFIGIVITLVLNFFLNPPYMPTAITELDRGTFSFAYSKDIIKSILIGLSLFINYLYAISKTEQTNEQFLRNGILNAGTSGLIGLPLPYGYNRNKNSILPRFLAAGIIILFYVLFGNYVCRIPLHSCAVVIIVGAWQNVKWGELKKAFSGIIPVIMFVITIVSSLVFDLTIGVIISAVLSFVYHKFLKKAV